MALVDRFGREVRKLRLGVTDRCNLRCGYCLPVEPVWLPRRELLTFEEIERVVRVLVPAGVRRLRLTGGEPLLRRDLPHLVERLRAVPGVEGLAMTSNGYYLDRLAGPLYRAGLGSVTVSLDAVDREVFDALVRRPAFDRVMAGLRAAVEVGFGPIKVNCVVVRGVNEEQVDAFVDLARSGPYLVRFIEFMPLDSGGVWDMAKVVTAAELRQRIALRHRLEPVSDDGRDPARRWRFGDGKGEVGFIASVSEPFCPSCDRIRLTAEGKILNCLFGHHEYDLRAPLRSGAGDDAILAEVRRAVGDKEAGHLINRPGFVKPRRSMAAIGG